MAAPARASRPLEPLLLLAFFISGASGLVFEVVWTRDLVLVFGATSLAVSSVLAAYMAGLGLGGLLGGRLADRLRHPLRGYAALELGVAVYGLAVPRLLGSLSGLYRGLYRAYSPDFATFSLLRFTVLFAVLLLPTTLMGATLPVLGRFAAERARLADAAISRLYAANTTGAVAGTLLAGFGLLPHLGATWAGLCACAAGGLLGLGMLALSRRAPEQAAPTPTPEAAPAPSAPRPWLVAAGFAFAGAASMIDEVAWTRALVQLLGPSTYAFSIMLATFLVGLALGSWVAARYLERVARPRLALGLTEAAAAAATVLGLLSFEPVEYLYRLTTGAGPGGRGPLALGAKALAAGALMLPSAAFIGAAFPLATAAYTRGAPGLARRVGELYAANTFGCIAGSLAAGFWLVPHAGIEQALCAAALLNLGVGLVLYLSEGGLSPALRGAGVLALGFFGLAVGLKGPRWDALVLATGARAGQGEALVLHQPGYNATVSVTLSRSARPGLALRTDGKADASDYTDLPTQVGLALVPLLFHPDPQDVLVVGLASGTTCGSALQDARVKRLDVLEIEPAMVAASHAFDHMNGRPLEDQRTHLLELDARNYYRVSERRYDVIISEPSNPWLTGPSHLFTAEAFREANGLLKPGGIMLQWLQGYEIHPETAASILGAFHDAFPYVRVFKVHGVTDTMLLGSQSPLPLDLGVLEQRIAPLRAELARARMYDAWDVAAGLVADVRSIEQRTAGARRNTDDNGLVEYQAPLDFGRSADALGWLVEPYPGPYEELAASGLPPEEIGGRLGWRMGEAFSPQLGPALARWLRGKGQPSLAERLEAMLRLDPGPAHDAPTPWEALLDQQRRWLAGQGAAWAGGPARPAGREFAWAALAAGEPDAALPELSESLLADSVGALAGRAAAERGDCAYAERALHYGRQLGLPLSDEVVGYARVASSSEELARAAGRCGGPTRGQGLLTLAHTARRKASEALLDLEPPAAVEALGQWPEDPDALAYLARRACSDQQPEAELAPLARLVALQPWNAPFVARLAHLAEARPGAARERELVQRAGPYLTGAKADGAQCPLGPLPR